MAFVTRSPKYSSFQIRVKETGKVKERDLQSIGNLCKLQGELGESDQIIHHLHRIDNRIKEYDNNNGNITNNYKKLLPTHPHSHNINTNTHSHNNTTTPSNIIPNIIPNHNCQQLTTSITKTSPSIPTENKKFKQIEISVDKKSMIYDFRTLKLKKYNNNNKLGNFSNSNQNNKNNKNFNKSCGIIQSQYDGHDNGERLKSLQSQYQNSSGKYNGKRIQGQYYTLPGSLSKKTMVKYMQESNKQNINNSNTYLSSNPLSPKYFCTPGPASYTPLKPTAHPHTPIFHPSNSYCNHQSIQIIRNRQKDQQNLSYEKQQNLFAVKYQYMNSAVFRKNLKNSSNLVNISNRILREKLFWNREVRENRESKGDCQQIQKQNGDNRRKNINNAENKLNNFKKFNNRQSRNSINSCQQQNTHKIQPKTRLQTNKNTNIHKNNENQYDDHEDKQQFQVVRQTQPGPAQYNLQHSPKNNGVLFGNTQRFVNPKSNTSQTKNQFQSQKLSLNQNSQTISLINNSLPNINSPYNIFHNNSHSHNDKNIDNHQSSMFCSQSQRFDSNISQNNVKLQYENTENSMLKQTKNRKKQINFGSSSPKSTNVNVKNDKIDDRPYYCVQKKLLKREFLGKFQISQGRKQLFDVKYTENMPAPNNYNVEPNWIKEHSCLLHQDAKNMPTQQKQQTNISNSNKNATFFLCSHKNLQKQSQNPVQKQKNSPKPGKLITNLSHSSSLQSHIKKSSSPQKLKTQNSTIITQTQTNKQEIALWSQWQKKSFNILFSKEPIAGNNPIQNRLLM